MSEQLSARRVPELDGLRGTAILSVLVFHYVSQQGAAQAGTLTHFLQRAAIMGWSGVDLFFVLSGFLIGGILMDARASSSYYRTFYARRFFRIVPIYYLWITVYVLAIALAGAKVQSFSNSGVGPPLGFSVYAHYLFLQNLDIPRFGGLAGAWFGHLWSLAVEEQFYLLAPLVVCFVNPRKLPVVLGTIIVCVPVLRTVLLKAVHLPPSYLSILMPCRADTLAMGMLAAAFWRTPAWHDWLGQNTGRLYGFLGVLLAGVAAFWIWAPQSGAEDMQIVGFTCLGLFYSLVLLLSLLRSSGPIAKIMRIRWLRELGTVSYCVYIIHIVVNVACHALLLHAPPNISTAKGAAVTVFAALLTYLLAKISWMFLENPLLRRGHAFKY
jgi:peptidoglycan/LPS O-acetylase OafA/YrhL